MNPIEAPSVGEGPKAERLINILDDVNVSSFLDSWGPTNVMHLYKPDLNMQGILVVDNISLGPGLARLKIAMDVTPRGVFDSARLMTWTTSLMDLRFGGAAAAIRADIEQINKAKFIKAFAKKVSPYIPERLIIAPGNGINQDDMKLFVEEIGDVQGACGKPGEMGGIPFELGTTGLGLGVTIDTSLKTNNGDDNIPTKVSEARIALQGCEDDNCKLLKFLDKKDAKVVAISNNDCTIYNNEGLDIGKLLKYSKIEKGQLNLKKFKDGTAQSKDDIFKVDADVLVITKGVNESWEGHIKGLKAKVIIEATEDSMNGPIEQTLNKKGVLIIPNIIAMAGASISASAEFDRCGCERAFSMIEAKIKDALKRTLPKAWDQGLTVRRIAYDLAKERIQKAQEGAF